MFYDEFQFNILKSLIKYILMLYENLIYTENVFTFFYP